VVCVPVQYPHVQSMKVIKAGNQANGPNAIAVKAGTLSRK